ncbi:MAG: hypothetical protein PHW50_02685 [Patescibacteria group bacterium]|nr:hypothetical protein [Patescibacteria group bacterium]
MEELAIKIIPMVIISIEPFYNESGYLYTYCLVASFYDGKNTDYIMEIVDAFTWSKIKNKFEFYKKSAELTSKFLQDWRLTTEKENLAFVVHQSIISWRHWLNDEIARILISRN